MTPRHGGGRIAFLGGHFWLARMLSQRHRIGVRGDLHSHSSQLLRRQRIVRTPCSHRDGHHHLIQSSRLPACITLTQCLDLPMELAPLIVEDMLLDQVVKHFLYAITCY